MSVVEYAVTDRVARITLNRPERGNGINRGLITEREVCIERADLDPAVPVILLAGNGKGFCSGYDLVESAEGQAAGARFLRGRRDRHGALLGPADDRR